MSQTAETAVMSLNSVDTALYENVDFMNALTGNNLSQFANAIFGPFTPSHH